MGLTYNGTSISAIKYNNIDLTKLIYNNTVVWESDTYITQPLCFTANTAGSTITLTKYCEPDWTGYYSLDNINWIEYTPQTKIGGQTEYSNTITLSNVGDKAYFKGTLTGDNNQSKYVCFIGTGNLSASGNIMSMSDGDNFASAKSCTYQYQFDSLFENFGALTNIDNLRLPATTLTNYCYEYLFYACSGLTSIDLELPATTLTSGCYTSMFNSSAITNPPALPATTLTLGCYHNMFRGCTSLTTLPALPATTLSDNCYSQMFYNCTSIKLSETQTGEYQIAYRIPTTGTGTTATNALYRMFYGTGGTFTDTPTINTTYYLKDPSLSNKWLINETPTLPGEGEDISTSINFTSDGYGEDVSLEEILIASDGIYYNDNDGQYGETIVYDDTGWEADSFRTVTFASMPTGDLLTWLQSNATLLQGEI